MWLQDDQYERVAAMLPGKPGDPGRSAKDNQLFVEAVLWVARTGSPWRDLPDDFGEWNSVYCPLVEQGRVAGRLCRVGQGRRL